MSTAGHPPGAPAAPVIPEGRVSPLRVLYVEDDRVTALLFAQNLLREPRIDLRIAEDGAEALAIAGHWLPEVLVLDAHLPDTTGHALLGPLRALPGMAAVPAIMCSADTLPEDHQRAMQAGFRAYWTKPVDPDEVLAALLALAGSGPPPAGPAFDDNPRR